MKLLKVGLLALILSINASKSYADSETVYVPGHVDCSERWSNFCGWPSDPFYDPSPGDSGGGSDGSGGGSDGSDGGGTTEVSAGEPKTPSSWNHNRQPGCLHEQRWVELNIARIME